VNAAPERGGHSSRRGVALLLWGHRGIWAQIAAVLGISKQAAKNRNARAKPTVRWAAWSPRIEVVR